jgi:hypothetical protein
VGSYPYHRDPLCVVRDLSGSEKKESELKRALRIKNGAFLFKVGFDVHFDHLSSTATSQSVPAKQEQIGNKIKFTLPLVELLILLIERIAPLRIPPNILRTRNILARLVINPQIRFRNYRIST